MLSLSPIKTSGSEAGWPTVIPYVIGVPLTESVAFYGRQETFKFIRDVLDAAEQNVIVLYGQRRIGKTSVLHRAAKSLKDSGLFFPVYYDLQGKERLSLGEALENLGQTIARRLGLPRPDPHSFDDNGSYFGAEFLTSAFASLGSTRLVLLIDEFDVLSDELESTRAASKTLFPYLQNLIVTRPEIGFVFVVGRRIEELATHFQAIFKQAAYGRVGHLRPEESRELIVEPAREMIHYTEDGISAIQALAAGHPFFTQLLCFEAFNAVKDGDKTVTTQVVDLAAGRAIVSGHGALNWFWDGLPRAERFILSAIAQATDANGIASKEAVRRLLEEHHIQLSGLEFSDAPDRLVAWEMLRHEGPDAYRFGVELVRRWIVAERPLSSARRDIDYVSKRAVRLFENARDAHSEGDLAYARDEYRRTLKANPNHSGAQLGLALVLFELGEVDESIVEFERAYDIDEMSARDGLVRARLAKAQTLETESRTDDAVAQYEQVLRLMATEETAIGRLGAIWLLRASKALEDEQWVAALAWYKEMLKYDRKHETLFRIQRTLLNQASQPATERDVETTVAVYTFVASFAPDLAEVQERAAAFASRVAASVRGSDRVGEAAALYVRLCDLFPDGAQLAEGLVAARKEVVERQNVNRIFDESFEAHRVGDLTLAREGYKKLICMDVLYHKGKNVATLLAATVTIPRQHPDPPAPNVRRVKPPVAGERSPDPVPQPEPQRAPAEESRAPRLPPVIEMGDKPRKPLLYRVVFTVVFVLFAILLGFALLALLGYLVEKPAQAPSMVGALHLKSAPFIDGWFGSSALTVF